MQRLKRISETLIASAAALPEKRYFADALSANHVMVLLQGARGVGKTTALLQYLNAQQRLGMKCLLVSADSVLMADLSLFDLAESFVAEGGQILAIDEIHKKDSWQQSLKSIFDSFPDLKLIASGSSAMQISKADLSRRAIKIPCFGLSFLEWLNLKFAFALAPIPLADLLTNHFDIAVSVLEQVKSLKLSIIELFKQYLKSGYFPTSLSLEPWVYQETLSESVRKTIEQDILACYPELTGKTIQRLKRCLAILSEKCPYTPDINELTAALDLSDPKSTKQYLYYLHESHLIRELAKAGKTVSATTKAEKIYLDNTNYLYALSRGEPEIGNVRETFMANMLSVYHQLHNLGEIQIPKRGDLLTPDGYLFEIGGRSKGFSQLAGQSQSWLVADDIDLGEGRRIPLWLFGCLW